MGKIKMRISHSGGKPWHLKMFVEIPCPYP